MAIRESEGVYVPTTPSFDVSEIYSTNVTDERFKELIIRLQNQVNIISLALNQKETGIYSTNEFLISSVYFPNPNLDATTSQTPINRNVYRVVIDTGALPNNTTKTVAHNIDFSGDNFTTKITATAQSTNERIHLNYVDATSFCSILIDDTNINITSNVDYSRFTQSEVVIEFRIG